MNKYMILAAGLLFWITGYSQVGINTLNPTGVLHIDPLKNTVGSTGTADDVIVNGDGNVGVGTIAPQSKIHINTSADKVALRLVDGNQKKDRVLLSSGSDGSATWGAIKGSGGETLTATVAQTIPVGGSKLYLTGTTTSYKVTGTGPYLVFLRFWARSLTTPAGSGYFNLLKNGVVVDKMEYYFNAKANAAFSFGIPLLANCNAGDILEIQISPSQVWTTLVSYEHTKCSTTFFLM